MNLYITPYEIKSDAPDMIQSGVTRYDDPLFRRCVDVSRAIDQRCKRFFYPLRATRYFSGSGYGVLWVPDLVSVETISVSYDQGATYEDLAEDDFYLAVAEEFDRLCSFNTIILNMAGSLAGFPEGQRSVRIVGVWGYADDREGCWEESGLTLAAEMSAGAGVFEVADAGAADRFGLGTALQVGRLIRVGAEYMVVTGVDLEEDTVSVIGGRNGTAEAAHEAGAAITLWRPPFNVVGAARITVIRDLLRAQQGYADARGAMELGGEMRWTGRWDPEALEKLRPLIRTAVG